MAKKRSKKPLSVLREYYLALDNEQRIELVESCNTTEGSIQQVYLGNRGCSTSLAVSLDKHTGGELTMDTLRPDIDWKYIRSTAGR